MCELARVAEEIEAKYCGPDAPEVWALTETAEEITAYEVEQTKRNLQNALYTAINAVRKNMQTNGQTKTIATLDPIITPGVHDYEFVGGKKYQLVAYTQVPDRNGDGAPFAASIVRIA